LPTFGGLDPGSKHISVASGSDLFIKCKPTRLVRAKLTAHLSCVYSIYHSETATTVEMDR